ncbi:hypothetical protein PPL_07749 [Heterostelium album PN500]|uniref:Uncharacterized protein n=1 Tax=Heterostelium pallidum (strain ATCC 26659 / Pp 5 / PN500) TaxID=670386 RepID=D3BGU7_HETP5|nr:hypothetical protein PPL_07749 [Heterostelium album PN500]EFA79331.1 hypothetical protein PPL_07749 [Heterostelium album PN500]|eukprot:XP_020431452.1 hypothetical protein PPL_07749 [Heterostelium album PN500]
MFYVDWKMNTNQKQCLVCTSDVGSVQNLKEEIYLSEGYCYLLLFICCDGWDCNNDVINDDDDEHMHMCVEIIKKGDMVHSTLFGRVTNCFNYNLIAKIIHQLLNISMYEVNSYIYIYTSECRVCMNRFD